MPPGVRRGGAVYDTPMTLALIALVLSAALMHAAWNAMLRSGADRRWSMLVMSVTMAAVCAAALPFAGLPNAVGWAYGVLSGVLHIGYNLGLIRMYRRGDLGQTYPVARGSSPLLVGLGAALFAGEAPGPLSVAGLLMVSGGILALAFRTGRLDVESVPAALATGCFIGAYSVADGLGVRAAGNPLGYIAISNLLGGALTAATLLGLPALRGHPAGRADTAKAAAGGAISLLAYSVVVWALGHAPMGPVSALRETSVVFAALLGRLFLGEVLTTRRVAACLVIAAGAACLGYADAAP